MKKSIAALLCLGALQSANAAIIDNNAGNFFSDTLSGLDWLDIAGQTAGMSYQTVEGQLNGGNFDGWQFATDLQLGYLGVNATTTGTNYAQLGIYFGATNPSIPEVRGMTYGVSNAGLAWSSRLTDNALQLNVGQQSYGYGYDGTNNQYMIGSFLVRQTANVPEPASMALFGLGLAGIAFTARRKRKLVA